MHEKMFDEDDEEELQPVEPVSSNYAGFDGASFVASLFASAGVPRLAAVTDVLCRPHARRKGDVTGDWAASVAIQSACIESMVVKLGGVLEMQVLKTGEQCRYSTHL